MRNLVTAIVAIILVVTIITGGILYVRLNNKINDTQSKIAALQSPGSTPQSAIPQISPAQATAMTMVDLIAAVQPVIVRVDATGQGFQSSGSGIIIRSNGYIITNEHVIDSSTSITVTLSTNQQYTASVKASDSNIDLAIIQLNNSPSNLPAAVLGSLSDVFVGENVTAAGFPLGPTLPGPASFTRGIVSAIRTIGGQRYIQNDVQINPGNSGGALVTNSGKVIGITTASVLPQNMDIEGIGLAIPIDTILTFIQKNLN